MDLRTDESYREHMSVCILKKHMDQHEQMDLTIMVFFITRRTVDQKMYQILANLRYPAMN